jgi:hypothetical protein
LFLNLIFPRKPVLQNVPHRRVVIVYTFSDLVRFSFYFFVQIAVALQRHHGAD